MENLINEDWEYEYKKMLVFLGEDEYIARLECSAQKPQIVVEDKERVLTLLDNANQTRNVSLQRDPKERDNS